MTAGEKMTAEVVDAPITQSGRDDLAICTFLQLVLTRVQASKQDEGCSFV